MFFLPNKETLIYLVGFNLKSCNNNSNSFETKLKVLENSIQSNLTIQNVKFDEFKNKIQENFNIFKDNTTKMIELLNYIFHLFYLIFSYLIDDVYHLQQAH